MAVSVEKSAVMAVYLDLENIVIGAREAKYPKFNIKRVLERLLLRGLIVVKKAYCDFDRYKDLKRSLHEAAFEMIEIPHVRQSGKNSADIRMVVDALDLCYTKSHVDTFVIISGDSDFSPLVSKLRENAKTVIGVGVKNSSSDLFINNCDEFIYYDDLVRNDAEKKGEQPKTGRDKGKKTEVKPTETSADGGEESGEGAPKQLDPQVVFARLKETVNALVEVRGESSPLNNSMVKEALKRRDPGFNERAFGFKTFGALLDAAAKYGFVKLEPNEKSGGFWVRTADHEVAGNGDDDEIPF
jgi:uncharacterized protein (TIGR00288 family)